MNVAEKERGLIILALFVLIIIGALIAGMLYIWQQERKADGQGTQIKIESTINL